MDDTIALTYRRVSTYMQERDGVSLDVQTDQCLDYIRRQAGWRLGGDFQDTLTGRTAKRPSYQAMLEEVRQLRARGERVVVVTAALDRMGRDLEESVRSRKELKQLQVPLHCIREGGVLQELQADVYASIAADESRRIGARVQGSRQHRRERGYRSPARAPWGYVWAPASDMQRLAGAPKSILRPDPEMAPYVREAWRRAAGGESIRSVARWIGGLTSEARGGRAFKFGNVLAMFKNPTYIARVIDPERKRQAKEARKRKPGVAVADLNALTLTGGRWEPLVDDETWTKVQQHIARHNLMPKQARGEYLLTGLLRCPRCSKRMQGRNDPRWARTYSCTLPGVGCRFTGRADVIDRALLGAVGVVLLPLTSHDREFQRALRSAWAKLQRPPKQTPQGRVKTLERLIAKARQRQDDALGLLADRVIDRERYDRFVAREQADIDAATRELSEIRTVEAPPTLPDLDEVLRDLGGWSAALATGPVPQQRAVLAQLIEWVVPVRVGYGKYGTDITWTPLGMALHTLANRGGAA